jgi:DNA-binding CsgD family transcriptional regulator
MEIVERMLASLPGPTMLVFEDLQWADDVSLEVIAELARRSRDRPFLLVGNYRIEDVEPGASLRVWRSRLITQRMAEEVRLARLTQAQTALVATLILDTGLPAPREVAEAVYARTDGLPLHIEELLGALSPQARMNGAAIREAGVPESIEDAVVARIAQRSPEAQAVARAGAVIGRSFVPAVLAGIMDAPPEALEAPLAELVDHFVLVPSGSPAAYDFRHQLLRDALYRTIPTWERRRFHARAGEFGAQLEGASVIHASVHYERAGLRRQAFQAALSGARDAARMWAHREAFDLYGRAVANVPDDLGPDNLAALLDAYAVEALAIDENEIAERTFREARAAYLEAGRPATAVEMLTGVLHVWNREARPIDERAELAASLLEEIERFPPLGVRGKLPGWLLDEAARIELDRMAIEPACRVIETMRSTAAANDDQWLATQADGLEAMAAVLEGEVPDGLDRIWSAALTAQHEGFGELGGTVSRDAATFAVRAMDYRRADRFLASGLSYVRSNEQSHCRHVMGATEALVAWARGEWDNALVAARQTIADRGSERAVAIAQWGVGFAAFGRGDLDTADQALRAALALGVASGAIDLVLPPRWGLAEAALLANRPGEAAAHCQEALSLVQGVGELWLLVPFVVTGVRAEHAAGRPTEAEAWLEACARHLPPIAAAAGPALDHGRGLVALAAGSTGIARQALEAAVDGWDERMRTWEATWARLDLGHCLARLNRFAEAVALAVDARTVASRLDSRPLAERADALQRLARGHVSVDEPWRPLTAREFAVARLISEGRTNAEIAIELSIAPKTASSHVEHILAKLGASRRTEIAAWAVAVERASGRG